MYIFNRFSPLEGVAIMETVINKWGNSLAIRIPAPLAQEIKITEGSKVEIVMEGGVIIIRRPRYTIDELVKCITPENLHTETQTDIPVGNEEW
jgi:antitoxin MazE